MKLTLNNILHPIRTLSSLFKFKSWYYWTNEVKKYENGIAIDKNNFCYFKDSDIPIGTVINPDKPINKPGSTVFKLDKSETTYW